MRKYFFCLLFLSMLLALNAQDSEDAYSREISVIEGLELDFGGNIAHGKHIKQSFGGGFHIQAALKLNLIDRDFQIKPLLGLDIYTNPHDNEFKNNLQAFYLGVAAQYNIYLDDAQLFSLYPIAHIRYSGYSEYLSARNNTNAQNVTLVNGGGLSYGGGLGFGYDMYFIEGSYHYARPKMRVDEELQNSLNSQNGLYTIYQFNELNLNLSHFGIWFGVRVSFN